MAPVRSACPAVEGGLRVAARIDGVLWYVVTGAATEPWIPHGIAVVAWVGFFLNTVLAIVGLLRGLEGPSWRPGESPSGLARE